jgi:magnesium-transporting ATPase (P-type)
VFRDAETREWKYVGDPTEVALVVGAMKARSARMRAVREPHLRPLGRSQAGRPDDFWTANVLEPQRLFEAAFDSDRKRMSVVYALRAAAVKDGHLFGLPVPPGCAARGLHGAAGRERGADRARARRPCVLVLSKGSAESLMHQCSFHLRREADGVRTLALAAWARAHTHECAFACAATRSRAADRGCGAGDRRKGGGARVVVYPLPVRV